MNIGVTILPTCNIPNTPDHNKGREREPIPPVPYQDQGRALRKVILKVVSRADHGCDQITKQIRKRKEKKRLAKSCYNCFNLIAKIPLSKGETKLIHRRLLYDEATAYCREGLLLLTNGKERIFKRVLEGPKGKLKAVELRKNANLDVYRYAEKCPFYDPEDEASCQHP